MTQRGQIYKCEVCGNIVEVLHEGQGELVCCGQPMKLQEEKTEEEGFTEKHVPVIEKMEKGVKVKIGSVPHPMEEAHYIEWVEVQTASGKRMKKFLSPGETPEVDFETTEEIVVAREYCSVHGLWVLRV